MFAGRGCDWTDGETKLLLDYYEQYFGRVGPMKKFRNKKEMWAHIGFKLKETLGVVRNEVQCCTRYKTVMKRKKTAVAHNSKSGNSPTPVPFEDEVEKIRWLDDSLEPAELRDSHGVVSKKARHSPPSSTASLFSEGGSDSFADEPASVVEVSQPSTSQGSAVEKRLNAKTARVSTARSQEVKLFFEEMERFQKLKEEQKAAREEERRRRHEEKKEYREELRQEKAQRHEQKMELLKRLLGLPEVNE